MAGDNELVIRVIGDDAQYTAVMKRVQRSIDKASGATERFGEHNGNLRRQFGLLDNAIRGAHSYAMIDMIRNYEKSAIVMAALPIASTIAGIAVLVGVVGEAVNKYEEWRRKSEEMRQQMADFQNSLADSTNSLHEKLLSVEGQVDALNHDYLGALKTKLELINDQSMPVLWIPA